MVTLVEEYLVGTTFFKSFPGRDIRKGRITSFDGNHYRVIYDNDDGFIETFDCDEMDNIFLKSDAYEAKARFHFFVQCGVLAVIAPALASPLTWAARRFLSGVEEVHDDHLALLTKHELGWMYAAAWYVLYRTRCYQNINSNGAGGGWAGRPNHVLPENDGPIRWVMFYAEDGGAFVITAAVLAGFVLPKVAFGLSLMYTIGRVRFANRYCDPLEGWSNAMTLWVVSEYALVALVCVTAIQTIALS